MIKKKTDVGSFKDFNNEYDTTWGNGLWYAWLINKIIGKMYRLLINMHNNIKLRIDYNSEFFGVFFTCQTGVRHCFLCYFLYILTMC